MGWRVGDELTKSWASFEQLCVQNLALAIFRTVFLLPSAYKIRLARIRADFREGDATKHFSVKKGVFSEKGGGNSVNEGFGKDFYRKGNSVKRFGPFSEPPESEN